MIEVGIILERRTKAKVLQIERLVKELIKPFDKNASPKNMRYVP